MRLALSWESLRRLGETRVGKLSIAAPFVGYILIYSQRLREVLALSGDGPAHELGRLHFTYFGLLLFGFGSIIFQLRCPGVNRHYSSRRDYLNGALTHVTTARLLDDFDSLVKEHGQEVSRRLEAAIRSDPTAAAGHDLLSPGNLSRTLQDHPLEFLQLRYDLSTLSRRFARLAVTCCYGIGLVLLAIPGVLVAFRVVHTLWPYPG